MIMTHQVIILSFALQKPVHSWLCNVIATFDTAHLSQPWKCNKCKRMHVGTAHSVMHQPVNWLSMIEYIAVSEVSRLQHVLFWARSFVFVQYCARLILKVSRIKTHTCQSTETARAFASCCAVNPSSRISSWFSSTNPRCTLKDLSIMWLHTLANNVHVPCSLCWMKNATQPSLLLLLQQEVMIMVPWLSIAFKHRCDMVYEVHIYVCVLLSCLVFTVTPDSGNQCGGTPVIVTGVAIQEQDSLYCLFGESPVEGVYIDSTTFLCVSPRLSRPGLVTVRVVLNGTRLGPFDYFFPSKQIAI